MKQHTFIAIEGVDFSGKTAVSQALVERGYQRAYFPTNILATVRSGIEALNDPDARFFYYITCVMAEQKRLAQMLEEDNVVADRYILSTFATNKVLGAKVQSVDFGSLRVIHPALTVVLTVNREVMEARRRHRYAQTLGAIPADRALEADTDQLLAIQQSFMEFGFPTIDTSNQQAEDIVTQILDML